MKVLESSIQIAFFDWVKLMRNTDERFNLIFAIPNQGGVGVKGMLRTIKMNKEGASKGFPDIAIPYPNDKYHGFFIELKTLKNKPSDEQLKWQKILRKYGYKSEIIKTNDVQDLILETQNYFNNIG